MRRIPTITFVLLALMFICANCKKKKPDQYRYPEDPAITKLTPKERLTGSWDILDYQFAGQSIVAALDTLNASKAKIKDVSIYYDFELNYKVWRFAIYNNFFQFDGDNAFNPDAPYDITIYGSANPYLCKWFITPFRYNIQQTDLRTKWTITKLYDKDLNLLLKTDSGDYKIFLKKM